MKGKSSTYDSPYVRCLDQEAVGALEKQLGNDEQVLYALVFTKNGKVRLVHPRDVKVRAFVDQADLWASRPVIKPKMLGATPHLRFETSPDCVVTYIEGQDGASGCWHEVCS